KTVTSWPSRSSPRATEMPLTPAPTTRTRSCRLDGASATGTSFSESSQLGIFRNQLPGCFVAAAESPTTAQLKGGWQTAPTTVGACVITTFHPPSDPERLGRWVAGYQACARHCLGYVSARQSVQGNGQLDWAVEVAFGNVALLDA